MQIKIEHATRETDATGTLVNFTFLIHYFDDSEADYTWAYQLTPDEVALGDIDSVIARETQKGLDEFNKILTPNIIETATDYIGATIDATTISIKKPINITPPIKLNAT